MPIIGSSKLQITGDITASGAIVAEEFKTDFVSGSILYNSGSSKFGDTRDDTHEFTGSISLSGSNVSFLGGSQVGIGTASPDNELHLTDGSAGSVSANSNTQFTVESSGHAGIQFLSPNSSNNIIYFGDVNDNDVGYVAYQHGSNIFNIVVNTTEAMFIDGGNGQDVVFPVANQKISGSVSSTGSFGNVETTKVRFTKGVVSTEAGVIGLHTNNYMYVFGGTTGLALMAETGIDGIKILDGGSGGAGSVNFETNNNTRATINGSGNVGIGTTVPSKLLTVAGDISGSGFIAAGTNVASDGKIRLPRDTGLIYARNQAGDGDIRILGIDGSNNIEIGIDGDAVELGGQITKITAKAKTTGCAKVW